MSYLLVTASLGLILGILLIILPEVLIKLNEGCNRVLVFLDERILSVRLISGSIFSLLGIWFIYSTPFKNLSNLWELPLLGMVAVVFGLCFILFPKAIIKLSELGNRVLVNTDTIVIKLRQGVGLSISLICLYLVFSALYLM